MFDYILIGIVQGIFEWLPISSEGVISILSSFLGDYNPIDIAVFVHLGTMFSALVYFRKDIFKILTKDKKTFNFLVIATCISLIIGFLFYNLIQSILIGKILLLLTALGLFITSYFHLTKKSINISFRKLGIITGVLQGLSIIPGVSRSGSTIFSLSLGDLKPNEILKLSYIMSIPVVIVSSVYILIKDNIIINAWPSIIVSFIVGLIFLNILLKVCQKINFSLFTFIFGILCILGYLII